MILERSLTEVDDDQLVKAALGDGRAFDLLYRRYVSDVYRYCFAQAHNSADAEDLTAQIFLAALESLPGYRGSGSFAAWLFGIARRKCADFHRAHYADRTAPLATADTLPTPSAADPEHQVFRRGLLDCIGHALRQLSADRREALYLRFWGGLSVRETAAVMRRSQGAVKMLVSRAIDDLQARCLDDEQRE